MVIIANDNAHAITGNPMEHAHIGDVLVHADGSRWELVAACQHPTVVLKRIGSVDIAPLDRDILSVVPNSPWAAQWSRIDMDGDAA